MKEEPLTFAYLDDLLRAAEKKGLDCSSHLAKVRIHRIGPLVELLIYDRSKPIGLRSLAPSREANALTQALAASRPKGTHIVVGPTAIGFIRTGRNPNSDDMDWMDFCLKARQAASSAGVDERTAKGLVGALREIESNVHEHSERANDGIVGYRCGAGEFEFVVADSGIGTLQSLRQNPKHADLTDAGRALQMALTDGVSRFADEQGRGYGFGDLFRGLADRNGTLRFRSGDHALLIDGTSPSLIGSQLVEKTDLRGFVASVVCRH